jgi:hypothetical protein
MMTEPIVLLYGGKARHGKDTAAAWVKENRGDNLDIRIYGFADELKREVCGREAEIAFRHGIKLDTNPDMRDPLCTSSWGKQPAVLQFYGSLARESDPFHWIKKLDDRIFRLDRPQIAIVKDCRYLNEMFWGVHRGGLSAKFTRLGYVDPSRDPKHPSETELDNYTFDYESSVADGDLEQLKADALEIFDAMLASLTPPEVTNDDFKVEAHVEG